MSFPPLLLGLYVVALLLALLLGALVGHSRPLSADGRRIADATERAGLGQNGAALRVALGVVALTSLLCGLGALHAGAPILPFVSVPPLVGLCTLTCGVGVCRTVTRAAARHLGLAGRDAEARLASRTALVATLLPAATSGLLVLGAFWMGEAKFGSRIGLQLAFAAAATVAVVSIVFSRTAVALIHGVEAGAPPNMVAPHPASLAAVVVATFERSLLSTASFMTASCLAHAVLLAQGVALGGEASGSALLYPHLLSSLALVALAFGGFVVRSSEREPSAWAWSRGALVSLLLLVAGAWSLGQSLGDEPLARLLPSGVTFFSMGAALCLLWLLGKAQTRLGAELGVGASFLLISWLCLTLLQSALPGMAVPAELIHALLVASVLSLLPLSQFWRVASELVRGAELSAQLVPESERSRSASSSPPPAFAVGHWLLHGVLGFEALELLPGEKLGSSFVGIGVLLGAVALSAALFGSLRSAQATQTSVARLLAEHAGRDANATPAGFGEVLDLCRASGFAGFAGPLGLVVGLPTLLCLVSACLNLPGWPATAQGILVGALALGAWLGFVLERREPRTLLGHASFAPPLALALVTWFTAGLQFL